MEYTISSIAPIFLFPFFAFVINSFIVKRFEKLAVGISTVAIFASFIYAFRIFMDFWGTFSDSYYIHKVFEWFDISGGGTEFAVNMGVYIDNMGAIMLLMVTAVAFLIHLFSTWYMASDAKFGKFFVYVSLFTSAMLGLVLADNLLMLFIFWEIMGFCSYSLIGFYHEKEKAGYASIKAFMTTRVGDVILLLGILAIWVTIGSVSYVDIYAALEQGKFAENITVFGLSFSLLGFIALTIFSGTVGKSAQFPLNVWLPDAMMGPTPCSALIHAATMVAAGVYLSLRMFPIMEAAGFLPVIAWVGGITAFGAATIALVQTDLKAVLAYSTISQLGYMVVGIGVGAYNPAFMHLITHAIFKACLFLAAGSVIHSLHDHHTHAHVQEMPRMGGLRKKLPFTFLAMMLCTLAIAGVPFFSGFVSKDRILGDALYMAMKNPVAYGVPYLLAAIGAGLTAFYMFRMMFLTFFGEPRDKDVYDHCHEEKIKVNRNVPLLILALFTLGVFFCGSLTGQKIISVASEKKEWFKVLVRKPSFTTFSGLEKQTFSNEDTRTKSGFEKSSFASYSYGLSETDEHTLHVAHIAGAIASVIIAFLGIFLAYLMYFKRTLDPGTWVNRFSGWYRFLVNKYFLDYLYIDIIIEKGLLTFNNLLAKFDLGIYDRIAIDGWATVNKYAYKIADVFDRKAIDQFAVDGPGFVVKNIFNKGIRFLLTGRIQFYFIVLFVFLAFYMFRISGTL